MDVGQRTYSHSTFNNVVQVKGHLIFIFEALDIDPNGTAVIPQPDK
jgi:hypothetical protein